MASTLSVDNIQGSASANTVDMSGVTNLHPPAGMVNLQDKLLQLVSMVLHT